MADTFAEFFTEFLRAHGYEGKAGRERFRALLDEKYATTVSIHAIEAWCIGARAPGRTKIFAVLDALNVYGDDRERVMKLAFSAPTSARPNRPESSEPQAGQSDEAA